MKMAGKYITGSAMIGEYFHMFISYGVVTIEQVFHAWKRQKDKEMERHSFQLEMENSLLNDKCVRNILVEML